MMIEHLAPPFEGSPCHGVRPISGEALRNSRRLTALLAAGCLLLAGCAVRTQRNVEGYVASVVNRQPPSHASRPAGSLEAAEPAVFTFSQACERAARFDQDVAAAMADVARLQVDVAQARSDVWPRVDLRTYFQIPLGGSNLEGVRLFNGGVFFRSDFQKMIFSGDAASAARARVAERRENLGLALDRLSKSLFLLLADRENLRAEVVLRRTIQNQTSDALERAHLLERNGRIKPERVLEYQYQHENSSRVYQDAVRRLAEINRALSSRLLIEGTQDVVITDLPELLSSMDTLAPVPEPDMQFFRDVWEKRHDTRAAEAALFVKEMAVIAERRKRIPSLTASFGLGSLSLTSTFSQAPVLVQLGASMPLLDFGDIKREIGKASIERDLARRNINLLLLKIQRGVLDSSAALSEAIAARRATEGQRRLISEQSEASQKLVAAGLVDPIDLLNFKVRASELDIELARTRINVSKAAVEYALASGRSLAGEPAPSQEKAK
jgi:outer membrane protein TolC